MYQALILCALFCTNIILQIKLKGGGEAEKKKNSYYKIAVNSRRGLDKAFLSYWQCFIFVVCTMIIHI
jgi:hypothetical protein